MAIELSGTLKMRGDVGPGVAVDIFAEGRNIRVVAGKELIADWQVPDIGIKALDEGFSIRAEGEEFLLRTDDDAALAGELAVRAASPRIARRLAAKGNPVRPPLEADEPRPLPNHLGALGMALGGALVVLGGGFLNRGSEVATLSTGPDQGALGFWLWFVVGGILMIGLGYAMSRSLRIARWAGAVVLLALMVAFGFAVTADQTDDQQLPAYGFVAGGLVLGVAVLSSSSLRQTDDG